MSIGWPFPASFLSPEAVFALLGDGARRGELAVVFPEELNAAPVVGAGLGFSAAFVVCLLVAADDDDTDDGW